MLKIVCSTILISSVLTTALIAQSLIPDDGFETGWEKASKSRMVKAERLGEYIEKGAELYLEFGLKSVEIQAYRNASAEISLEIYEFESPDCALGLYLMKRGAEDQFADLPARNSSNLYQFLILKSKYVLQIQNLTGHKDNIKAMSALAKSVLNNIPFYDTSVIPNLLPRENLIPGTERMFRGPEGLKLVLPFMEGDALQLRNYIWAIAADYRDDYGLTLTRVFVTYAVEESAELIYEDLKQTLISRYKITEERRLSFSYFWTDYNGLSTHGSVKRNGRTLEIASYPYRKF